MNFLEHADNCQQNFERLVTNEIDAMSLDDTDTIDDEQNAEHWRKIMLKAKLYIPSTLNTDYLLWYTQLIVCAVKYYIMVIISLFKFFWGERTFQINLKIQD